MTSHILIHDDLPRKQGSPYPIDKHADQRQIRSPLKLISARHRLIFVLALIVSLFTTNFHTSAAPPLVDIQPTFPIRAAFYYPWFAESWTQLGIYPYTNYTPSIGFYDLTLQTVIKQQNAMQYGGIQAGIASWWGQGTKTDARIPTLLQAAAGTSFRWALYYEQESLSNPSASQITGDLTYIRDHYGNDPGFLRVGGRFVVFVYADPSDACNMANRWKQANTVGAYIVLKVFDGYANCAGQPESWHQYSPAVAADSQGLYSYTISPGFWLKGDAVRLRRDLAGWNRNIRNMIASGADFQLITTFNEWGEGTSVESAAEWSSASGYGAYLDALHNNGNEAQSTSTRRFIVQADAQVKESNPNANYAKLTRLLVGGGSNPDIESYLRFTVSGVTGTIQRARIRLYVPSNGSINGPAIYGTGNSWLETGITWNTRPARTSGALANKGSIGTAVWVVYDVTPLITGNGTFSFVLVADGTDGVQFASRESTTRPKLVVTFVP